MGQQAATTVAHFQAPPPKLLELRLTSQPPSPPCCRSVVRTEYLSAFRTLLTLPLRRADAEAPGGPEAAISTVLELMNDYCISREQVWGESVTD